MSATTANPKFNDKSRSDYFGNVEDVFKSLNNITVSRKNGRHTFSNASVNRINTNFVTFEYTFDLHPQLNHSIELSHCDNGKGASSTLLVTSNVLENKNKIKGSMVNKGAIVNLRYQNAEDFLQQCNQQVDGKKLLISGKVVYTGDFAYAKILTDVFEKARTVRSTDGKYRPAGSSRTSSVTTGKKRKLNLLRRLYSSRKSSFYSSGSVDFAEPETVGSETDEGENSRSTKIFQDFDDKSNQLNKRCQQLEAQIIFTTAQQLSILAQFLAILLSLISYWLYIKGIWWLCDKFLIPVIINDEKECKDWYSMVEEFIIGSRDVEVRIINRETCEYTLNWVKYILSAMPYFYDKRYHGITHRRFEVFAVAFIFIVRIKLIRQRVRLFTFEIDNTNEHDDEPLDNQMKNNSRDGHVKNEMKENESSFAPFLDEDAVWEISNEINARFLYASILRLRGLWIKTAQYFSARADFVPDSYVKLLSKLQDEAPESRWEDVLKILHRSGLIHKKISEKDKDGVLDIVQKPIASASIGQVHIATLASTKEKVVVKVQHPHARPLLLDDFKSLGIIMKIISILEPEYGFVEILMKEWTVEARKELDFLNEASNLESARASVKKMVWNQMTSAGITNTLSESGNCIPFSVEIPRPFSHLCSRDVLVMSFCEGKRADDLKQIRTCGIPKEAVVDAIAQTFAHMMYATEIFNGDPHPGNIFIRPGISSTERCDDISDIDGENKSGFTVILLDWGLAKRLPEAKRLAFCQMVFAASTFDFGLMMDSFEAMGLRLKRENVAEDMEGVRFLLRDMVPKELSRKRISEKMKTDIRRSKQKARGERVPVESKAYPGEFFFFVRTNELLQGLGSKLGVNVQYLDVLKPYAENVLLMAEKKRMIGDPSSDLLLSVDKSLEKRIQNILEELEENGDIAGCQICVLNETGQPLVQAVAGHMGGLMRKIPMRPDAIILGHSVTKAITATLAHVMVQEGYISYDEPICERIWPKFCPYSEAPDKLVESMQNADNTREKWSWKKSITLRHILSHTSGMWSALPSKLTINILSSCEECCLAFEYDEKYPLNTLLPTSKPGAKCAYHFLSFGWLVAGCLKKAYELRHKKKVRYDEVYDAILKPILPPELFNAGFRPCGGVGNDLFAMVDASYDMSRIFQMQRESEAVGEKANNDLELDEMGHGNSTISEIKRIIAGKEFLLDPRIWNSTKVLKADIPAAGGRFSAKGLALFYHKLGTGCIVDRNLLDKAFATVNVESEVKGLQGRTIMSSNSIDQEQTTRFGLGYQIIELNGNKNACFGHAGIGGSIGFFHDGSKTSVAIMLNKGDAEKNVAKKIIDTISTHLKW